MLDLKYVLSHLDEVKENCRRRKAACEVERLENLAERRSALKIRVDGLRSGQKALGKAGGGKLGEEERTRLREEGRRIKEEITELRSDLETVEAELFGLLRGIPNTSHPDAPVGEGEKDNRVLRYAGERPTFDFSPRDHVELGSRLAIIDFEAGTKVSGKNFYFLWNQGVFLELALVRYALDVLAEEGFSLCITPDLARDHILDGIGFSPRGPETQVFSVEGMDISLIGTAEITLGGMRYDEILTDLPLRLGGLSHCFRTEAGAYGKASRGLYRVHQFTKVEMFVFSQPTESDAMLEKMLAVEERIFSGLEVPYRVVDCCTGELGGPAHRKYDLEAWMPGRGDGGEWGEVTSASNCTDYQARRLRIRYKEKGEKGTRFVHTLNGTAVAVSRALIALIENHQGPDGTVTVPKALRPYTGFETIEPPR